MHSPVKVVFPCHFRDVDNTNVIMRWRILAILIYRDGNCSTWMLKCRIWKLSILVGFWHWRTACSEVCCLPSGVNRSRLWREKSVCLVDQLVFSEICLVVKKGLAGYGTGCGGNLPGKGKAPCIFHTDLLSAMRTLSIRRRLRCRGFLSSVTLWHRRTKRWRQSSKRWCHFLVKTLQVRKW